MKDTLTRQIKVYCPTHQSVFEVADEPKIVCEIREHSLSDDFPKAEFWSYCCGCQTFSPSDLEVGGKGETFCPHCERPTVSRFICGNCKIVANDSGENTKGKNFSVDTDAKTIEPACPGCLTAFSDVKLLFHKCDEAEAVFLTSRSICPFCQKETAPPLIKKTPPKTPSINCPNCKTLNPADNSFCLNCGEVLHPKTNIEKRGTSTAKTQLLGSICPTCGVTNKRDSVFCPNCGQSLKAGKSPSKRQPATPPPTNIINANQLGSVRQTTPPKWSNAKGCLIVTGILFGSIMLCSVCQAIISKNKSTTSTPGVSYTPTSTPYPDYSPTSTPYSSNSYVENSEPAKPSNTNKPMNANAATPAPSLQSSFTADFTGTIGGKYFTMSLTRDGSSLTGSASTFKTDSVKGTIDKNGNFTLEGFEDDGYYSTGTYKGRIKSDGSISGNWTNSDGAQRTPFNLTEN